MRYIPLTQNQTALVDDEDYDCIMSLKWFAHNNRTTYYAWSRVDNRIVCMHWFVVGMPLPGFITDHKNSNGLDNRRDNLRTIYKYQNHQNLNIRSTSKYPGVSFSAAAKTKGKWRAGMRQEGISINLGNYCTEFEAFCAYREGLISRGKFLLAEWEDEYATSLKRMEELNGKA